jgi:uncharacterized protein (DUF1810 family)
LSVATAADPFALARFIAAQAPVWLDVVDELRSGRKTGHWMWFVFPQLRGLGSSAMAERFGLSGLDEAEAYLAHAVLGPRLREAVALVAAHRDDAPDLIFGETDAMKLCSCLTLFAAAAPGEPCFMGLLRRAFAGRPDPRTLDRLAADDDAP